MPPMLRSDNTSSSHRQLLCATPSSSSANDRLLLPSPLIRKCTNNFLYFFNDAPMHVYVCLEIRMIIWSMICSDEKVKFCVYVHWCMYRQWEQVFMLYVHSCGKPNQCVKWQPTTNQPNGRHCWVRPLKNKRSHKINYECNQLKNMWETLKEDWSMWKLVKKHVPLQ